MAENNKLIQKNTSSSEEDLTGDPIVVKKGDSTITTTDKDGYRYTSIYTKPSVIGKDTKLVETENYGRLLRKRNKVTKPDEGALKDFLSFSEDDIDSYKFTPEKKRLVIDSLGKGMTLLEAITNVSINEALQVLDLDSEMYKYGPSKVDYLNIDTSYIDSQIISLGGDKGEQIRLKKTSNILKRAKDEGFKVLRDDKGLYWLESEENGVKKYAINGLLDIKELLDKVYPVGGFDETSPIPDDAAKEIEEEEKRLAEETKKTASDTGGSIFANINTNTEPIALAAMGGFQFTEAERWYLVGFLGDILSTGIGIATKAAMGAGSVISFAAGIGSIIAEGRGDYLSGKSTWDIAKYAVIRTGMELAEAGSIIPVSLIYKMRKGGVVLKLVQRVMHVAMVGNIADMAASPQNKEIYDKLTKGDITDLTVDDWRHMSRVLTGAMAVGSVAKAHVTSTKEIAKQAKISKEGLDLHDVRRKIDKTTRFDEPAKLIGKKVFKKKYKESIPERDKIRADRDAKIASLEAKKNLTEPPTKPILDHNKAINKKIKFAYDDAAVKIKNSSQSARANAAGPRDVAVTQHISVSKGQLADKIAKDSKNFIFKDQRVAEEGVKRVHGEIIGKRKIANVRKNAGQPAPSEALATKRMTKQKNDITAAERDVDDVNMLIGNLKKNKPTGYKQSIKDAKVKLKDAKKSLKTLEATYDIPSTVSRVTSRIDEFFKVATHAVLPNDARTIGAALKSLSLSDISVAGKEHKHTIYSDRPSLIAYLKRSKYSVETLKSLKTETLQDLMRYVIYFKQARPPASDEKLISKKGVVYKDIKTESKRSGGRLHYLIPKRVRKAEDGIIIDENGEGFYYVDQNGKALPGNTPSEYKVYVKDIDPATGVGTVHGPGDVVFDIKITLNKDEEIGSLDNTGGVATDGSTTNRVDKLPGQVITPAMAAQRGMYGYGGGYYPQQMAKKRVRPNLLKYLHLSDLFGWPKQFVAKYDRQHVIAPKLDDGIVRDMPGLENAMSHAKLQPRIDTADYLSSNAFNLKAYNSQSEQIGKLTRDNSAYIQAQRDKQLGIRNQNVAAEAQAINANIVGDNKLREKQATLQAKADKIEYDAYTKKIGNIGDGIMGFTMDSVDYRKGVEQDTIYNDLNQKQYIYMNQWAPRINALMAEGKVAEADILKDEFEKAHGIHPDVLGEKVANALNGVYDTSSVLDKKPKDTKNKLIQKPGSEVLTDDEILYGPIE